jgi:hypothetical protein
MEVICTTASWVESAMILLVHGAPKLAPLLSLERRRHFGYLIHPKAGNKRVLDSGRPFAVENGAFTGFSSAAFIKVLGLVADKPNCLWVAAPDVVGDAIATAKSFEHWYLTLKGCQLPVAYVAQDGLTVSSSIPWDEMDCLFIGGTNAFKLGESAMQLMKEANRRGKWVHFGRVNSLQRLRLAYLWGADSVDGSSYNWFSNAYLLRALDFLIDLENGWDLKAWAAVPGKKK